LPIILITYDRNSSDSEIIISITNKTIDSSIAKAYTNPFSNTSPVDILTSNLLRRSASHAFGDYLITCPTIIFGAKLIMNSKFKGNVYQYRLIYINSKSPFYGRVWANTTHEYELPLVFGRPLSETSNDWTQIDMIVNREFINIWTPFARNGFDL
jgi:hypothetical protein